MTKYEKDSQENSTPQASDEVLQMSTVANV